MTVSQRRARIGSALREDEQLRLAKEQGAVVTLAGRRWPIGGLSSLDSQLRSYAERLARRATHEGSVATWRGARRCGSIARCAKAG